MHWRYLFFPGEDLEGVPFDKIFRSEFSKFSYVECNVISTRPDQSRSIPAWAHLPPRFTRHDDVVVCTRLYAKKCDTHSRLFYANSSFIYLLYSWPTQTSFSCEKWWVKLSNSLAPFPRGKLGTATSLQFVRKSDPNVFVEDRPSGTPSNCGKPLCIQRGVGTRPTWRIFGLSFDFIKLGLRSLLLSTRQHFAWLRRIILKNILGILN